jgi:hypothetical protein
MLLLTLPTAATFRCRQRTHLLIMTVYTLAITVTGIIAVVLVQMDDARCYDYISITAWGSVLSSFASNILGSMILKK